MGPSTDQPIRSVVVDDDLAIGGILGELISAQHVAVQVFSDAGQAMQYVKKQPVDIVITDLLMPGASGLDILSLAKEKNPEAIVIIITGHGTLETAIEAVKNGAYDYIRKPFKLDEIEIAFGNAVEKVQLVRKNKDLLQRLENACDEIIAIKKTCTGSNGNNRPETDSERTARLNFFSTNLPNLDFFHKANKGQQELFDRLDHISSLKKEGLLTEKEFKALKNHIINGLAMFAAQ